MSQGYRIGALIPGGSVSLVNDPEAEDLGVIISFGNFAAIDVANPLVLDGLGPGRDQHLPN